MQHFFDKSIGVRIGIGFVFAILLSLFFFYTLYLLSPVFTANTGNEILQNIASSSHWNETDKIGIFYMRTIQTMSMFLVPAIILLTALYRNPGSILQENHYDYRNIRHSLFILLILTIVTTNLPGINLLSDINTQGVLKIIGENSEQWVNYQNMEQFTEKLLDNSHFLLSVFCMAIVPAVCEEVFFRGFLQTIAIRVFKNQHIAILCTALIFSIMHNDFFNCIPRFILGIFLGYLFVYTRNILFPIVAHTMHNAWVVILCFPVFPDSLETIGQLKNFPLLGILSLLLLGLFMLKLIQKTQKAANTDNLL